MKISVFGDICPTKSNLDFFSTGNSTELFGDTLTQVEQSGWTLVNLECPYTDGNIAIEKSGPSLKAPKAAINAVIKAGFSAASLANNHIRDYSDDGIRDTVELCEKKRHPNGWCRNG